MKEKNLVMFQVAGIVVVSLLVIFNSLQVLSVSQALTGKSAWGGFGSGSSVSKSSTFKVKSGGDTVQNVIDAIVPKGVPVDYGEELGVSFDDPVKSLAVLANLDRKVPTESLSAEEKAKFVGIATKISCEFCCGAPSVADQNGRSLCGCSHANAFRGLPKYLVKNHPDWTDEQVYAEVTKWKVLFFPKNMVEKGVAAVDNGLELTPAVLNDRDLLNKLKSGDTKSAGISELPSMVGGC